MMASLGAMGFCEPMASGVRLFVRVSPKASRDRIEGIERAASGRARLRVRVTAAPDKGAANARVIALIAKALHIAASSIAVRHGAQDRSKTLEITGNAEDLMARLGALVGEER